MGPVTGEDGVTRCPWAGGPGRMRDYHDQEWGRRVQGESAYLERLTLEAFQSGLSWSTILDKREAFREVFHGFDADAVATFDDTDQARLMDEPRIIRNRLKIAAAVTNARATVTLRDSDSRGLEALVLDHAPTDSPAPTSTEEQQTTSSESVALAKVLKRHGFVFVGATTMFALMEATGVFDPHLVGCHRRGRGERRD